MLGDQIKRLRISKNYSQVELARRLNVSKQSVSNWENNNITPSVDILKQIALELSVTTDYLLELEERFIIDVSDLPIEIVSHFQQLINDYKRLLQSGRNK